MSPAQAQQEVVQPSSVGTLSIAPPTFLERWGVVFVACAGGWILMIASGMLIYFLRYLPSAPNVSGLTSYQAKDALSTFKQLTEHWRDALTYAFDLMVTKTVLPLVTLLLGYLFGKKS